jgi:hypothetical protein
MKIIIIICLMAGISSTAVNATTIKGVVTDALTQQPLNGVYVYINQSTQLAITDTSGKFEFNNLNSVEADLIATKMGFETLSYHINLQKIPAQIHFEMAREDTIFMLGWIGSGIAKGNEWFQLFQNFFMGHSAYASQCEILNSDILHFKWNDSTQILDVKADGPLLVSNEALGYLLIINLDDFKMNKNGDMVYDATVAFKPLHSKSIDIINKWHENRKKNYATSQVAFWKSLFNDSLQQNGFSVQFIKRIFENDLGYSEAVNNKKNTTGIQSVKEGNNIVKKKFVDVQLNGTQNKLSNFLQKKQSGVAILSAAQYILQIKYRRVDAWALDERNNGFNPFLSAFSESYSYIIFSNNISINQSGYVFPTSNFWVIGDWNWMGLSTALPYDLVL